jgi:hypothetical protein
VLVGTGAVSFALDPDLTSEEPSAAPFWYPYGDEVFFQAIAPGAATITASAPGASVSVTVNAVDASAIDTITTDVQPMATGQATIAVAAAIGNLPVYGARCAWTGAPDLAIVLPVVDEDATLFQSGGLGDVSSFKYQASGASGTYAATCTIPGGLSKTISVTIE